jgi:hypothetical protein
MSTPSDVSIWIHGPGKQRQVITADIWNEMPLQGARGFFSSYDERTTHGRAYRNEVATAFKLYDAAFDEGASHNVVQPDYRRGPLQNLYQTATRP